MMIDELEFWLQMRKGMIWSRGGFDGDDCLGLDDQERMHNDSFHQIRKEKKRE